MYDKDIAKATTERSLKTLVQTFVALTGANALDAVSTSASANLKISLGAAVLSILTSTASRGFGKLGPSLSTETVKPSIIEIPAPAPAPAVTVSTASSKPATKATAAKAKATVKKAAPAKKAPAKKSTASAKKKTK